MIHPSASRLLQSLFLCSVQVCLSSAATDTQPECLLFPALENKDQAFHCPAVTVLQIFLAGLPPIRNDYSVVLFDLVECADVTFRPGGYPHPPLETVHVCESS